MSNFTTAVNKATIDAFRGHLDGQMGMGVADVEGENASVKVKIWRDDQGLPWLIGAESREGYVGRQALLPLKLSTMDWIDTFVKRFERGI